MKTLFPLIAALALFAMFSPAQALPNCMNVNSDSRLAGCHGLPDFDVVTSMNDNGRADTDEDARNYSPVNFEEDDDESDPDNGKPV